MSVHFYNTRGWMVGIDSHKFQMAVPPDPAPVPIRFFPYFVGVPLSWGICDTKSIVRTVTANGAPVLQKGHKKKMVPHVFVPCALPHPFQAVQGAAVIAKARTVCVMAVSSVTGAELRWPPVSRAAGVGMPTASEPVPAPSGNVINPSRRGRASGLKTCARASPARRRLGRGRLACRARQQARFTIARRKRVPLRVSSA